MIIALTGGTRAHQYQIVREISDAASHAHIVTHCDHYLLSPAARNHSIGLLYPIRYSRDAVVVITGMSTAPEYERLRDFRALTGSVFGILSPLFNVYPMDKNVLFVAPRTVKLNARQSLQYITGEDLFSEALGRVASFEVAL